MHGGERGAAKLPKRRGQAEIAHLNSATRVFPALGTTGSASEIIRLLEDR